MPDPSPSTLTVLNSNFLQLGEGVVAGHSRQFTPGRLPDNCETQCVSGNRTHDLPIVPRPPMSTMSTMSTMQSLVVL